MGDSKTINLAVWGAPDSGKSTFIAALLHLIRPGLTPEEAARLEKSDPYIDTAERLVNGGLFPANTALPRVIEWQHTPTVKIRLMDIPGAWCYGTSENLQLMKQRPINAVLGSVYKYLTRADGIFLLFETGDYYEVLSRIANFLNGLSDDMGDIRPVVAYTMTKFREARPEDLPARPQTLFKRRFGDPSAPPSPLRILPLSHSPEQAVVAYLNAVTIDSVKGQLVVNAKTGSAIAVFNALLGKLAPDAVSKPSRPKRTPANSAEKESAPPKPSHTRTTKPRSQKMPPPAVESVPAPIPVNPDVPSYAAPTLINPPKKGKNKGS